MPKTNKIFLMLKITHPLLNGIFFALSAAILYSCGDSKPQRIVDNGIEAHGGGAYRSFHLEFDFRDRHYTASRKGGLFTYTREFTDTTGVIKDVLNNDGLTRFRNGAVLDITDERKQAFTRSVNSVIYFALLPFGLNDDAVNKQWVKEAIIKNEPYDVVRVTFDQGGGGEDHSDVFLYWFHQQKHTMDYFAYSYETEGGGLRFREAFNPRTVGGILWQDYVNYKPADESVPPADLEPMFVSGSLEKLSEIKMENVKVSDYKEDLVGEP
ncbi:MAG: DUF6503 family protein [Cyclobacteriaceae bacterium]